MNNIQFNLNLTPGNAIPQRVRLSQYDNIMPKMIISLYDGYQVFNIPTTASVYIAGTKKDHTGFEYECTFSGNVVTAVVTEQMTAFAGDVTCEIIVQDGQERKGSANFVLDVEKAALAEDVPISETDIPVIEKIPEYVEECERIKEETEGIAEQAVQDVEDARTGALSAISSARNGALSAVEGARVAAIADVDQETENAEAWAVGQRGGVDVPATDPTYHNNSKYYSELTETIGTEKVQDAEAWAVGERAGVPVPASDETHNNNAKYYAGVAATEVSDAADLLEDAMDTMQETKDMIGATTFHVNFSSGNLEYDSPSYDFSINTTTGNLEWEVAA